MRRTGPPSEIQRLAAPVGQGLDWAWRHMHWWIAIMVVLYACSGISIIRPDESAVILRWGRLVGTTPALQQHGSGLLFAFPRPIDEVVRVQTKHVWEVPVTTLAPGPITEEPDSTAAATLNPITQGYALSGDQNIVQTTMVARYRIGDPAEWAFYGAKSEDVLRVEVTAAMVRSLGEMGVDTVLSDGRQRLIATVARRVQQSLDATHSGLQLASLELTHLGPPAALANDFDSVQSAYIEAQTQQSDAHAFAERAIPSAQADADERIQAATGQADADMATATGDADAFRALDKEYRADRAVVRERLYRDAVEKAIKAAGSVQWVPPPDGGKYHGFRISVTTGQGTVYVAPADADQ